MTDEERIERLEKLVVILLYISKENHEFYGRTTREEQQLAADLYDEKR